MAFSQKIAEGLTLRSVQGEADKEHFAAFNAVYNNASEGATCACLLHYHPHMSPEDFWLVESDTTREIVSSTCLIPWALRFAGVDLRAAQFEMVLTRPDYRGRGLVRAQIEHFERVVRTRGFDFSFIWGIPYYYRQFGYAYAIEGATVESLPVRRIPGNQSGENLSVRLRPAGLADIPCLMDLYGRAAADLDLAPMRNSEYWSYLLEAARHPIEMVERAETGDVVGYAVISRRDKAVSVLENSLPDAVTALALLKTLTAQASEQVQISWPGNTPLVALARQLGSQTIRGGQWLLRIPQMASLLNKLRIVFERRLVDSAWHDLSTEIKLNLFREAFCLRFKHGKLTGVDCVGFVDSSMGADCGHLCIPPDAFLRLLFGYRALDELFDAWPDIVVKPEVQPLLNTLFPRLEPYLYTPYHYLGSLASP
jgi:predicted acetyltransferase